MKCIHIIPNNLTEEQLSNILEYFGKLTEKGIQNRILLVGNNAMVEEKIVHSGLATDKMMPKEVTINKVRRYLINKDVNFVHNHLEAKYLTVSLGCILSGKKCVATIHTAKRDFTLSQLQIKFYSMIIVGSEKEKISLLKNKENKKVKIIMDGERFENVSENADSDKSSIRKKFEISESDFVIGQFDLIERNYDQLSVVKSLRKMITKDVSCTLILNEDGAEKEKLSQYINRHKLNEKVKFICNQENERMLYGCLDAYVASGFRIEHPVKLMRAMSAGNAVVATKIGRHIDLIKDRENGYLVPCGFPERIESALKMIEARPELKAKVSAEAKNFAQRWLTIESVANRYVELYQTLQKN